MQWRMGLFRLDQERACLWRGDGRVGLRPKTYDLLVYLVEHAGELVSKDDLLAALWPDVAVAESVLTARMSELRKALGETARAPQYIATEHRRGYRFIAPVTPIEPPMPPLSIPPEPPSQEAPIVPPSLAAERRQLTVLCCDLVDSTRLAGQLDPEDWHEVLDAYHQSCTEVVARFDGYLAQYLGDGVLAYFGYPVAHEDDAQRAVWSSLALLEALETLNAQFALPSRDALAVRLGLHTGLVVMASVGAGGRQEPLARGETPHIAARLQRLAQANELVISAATRELLGEVFRLKGLGEQELRDVATPMRVYRVEGAQAVESRFEAMNASGLNPLVGREEELELLWRRWRQACEGEGQVVLLNSEAGLGKSRLVWTLCERLRDEPHLQVLYQGSPYHTNSAFHPIVAHLERTLQLEQASSPAAKLDRLETLAAQSGLPVSETVPLLALLLSIPSDARYPPPTLSPERQKERIIEALAAQLVSLSRRDPLLLIFEDAHWSDPSTLEVFDCLINSLQEASVLAVVTYRPGFESRWRSYGHVTTHMLNRLTRRQAAALATEVAGGKALPQEILDQIVAKTDGVPLFVEELTKAVLESELPHNQGDSDTLRHPLPTLAIPATLQDSLMARLDQMKTAKEVAQLGSVLGREFAYDMLQALWRQDEETLQAALAQLVQAGLLYQQGQPSQARYLFKHALIQDAAYASMLRSTRQGYHRQMAQQLETRFPAICETQPELVAHHYTAANCPELAIGYWQRAGQQATQRSACQEAMSHLKQGLALLAAQPDTLERRQQELAFQMALGPALMVIKGYGQPEVEQAYARARALCRQVGETPELFPVLYGLWRFYLSRGALHTIRELAEQLLALAQRQGDPALLLAAHSALGTTLFFLGEFALARLHLEEGIGQHTLLLHRAADVRYGEDPGGQCYHFLAWTLWHLGYPEQALQRSHEERALAQTLVHPTIQALALYGAARLRQLRRDVPETQELAEATIAFATEQGNPHYPAQGIFVRGWALFQQGQHDEGREQMQQGLAAYRAAGGEVGRPLFLALLAEAYGTVAQADTGRSLLAEAQTIMEQNGQRYVQAECHRLEGELQWHQTDPDASQAERCFHQALDIARHQQAKSWELRAATSLACLWQSQGKRQDAYDLLAPVYGWFTEGFDTADLQEAKMVLEELTLK